MTALFSKLGLDIPSFALKRLVRITVENSNGIKITVTGLDKDGDLPYSFIRVSACLINRTRGIDFASYCRW